MSNKTQPIPLPGHRATPPEIQLTWNELALLRLVLSVDLNGLEQSNSHNDANVLGEPIQTCKDLLAKLDLMRVEALRRERP